MNKSIIPFALASSLCQAQNLVTVQDALKLASQNRPALQAARLSVDRARAEARAASAPSPLEIGIGASSRNDVGATDQDLFLSQEVDLVGRRNANRRLGEAHTQLAYADYISLASDLQDQVLTSFADSVSAKRQRDVSEALLELSRELSVATKRRFDEGKVAELQVTRASIELERAKQAAQLWNAEYQASLIRLAGVLGVQSENLSVDSESVLEPLPDSAPHLKPELFRLKAEALIASFESQVARVSRRPGLNLQVVRSPWGAEGAHFAGRVQFSWAVTDHGKSNFEGRAAQLKAESAQKQLDDATALAEREIESANIELSARRAGIESYQSILVSAKDLVAKSQKGYSEGFGTQIDVLEATRALREVEQELVIAKHQLSLAVIAQYRAAGFLAEVLK